MEFNMPLGSTLPEICRRCLVALDALDTELFRPPIAVAGAIGSPAETVDELEREWAEEAGGTAAAAAAIALAFATAALIAGKVSDHFCFQRASSFCPRDRTSVPTGLNL